MAGPAARPSARGALVSRRGLLVAASAGAVLAAACSRSTAAPAQAPPPPRAARATGKGPPGLMRRGGVLRTRLRNDYVNLDPHATALASAQWAGMIVYSRLLRFALGPGEDNLAPRIAPDVATATGESIDGERVVFRLREDALFQDLPPVHGRQVTARDVQLSFERARAGKTGASLAAIASVEAPDRRTVVLKLKKPAATLATTLASAHGLFILPYEVDLRFDPSRTPVGSGPWMLDRLEPAVQVRWKAKPRSTHSGSDGYSLPYLDGFVEKVIPEDGTATAQFAAGELDVLETSSQDLFALQDAVPEAQIVAFPQHGFSFMGFSGSPGPLNQFFRDLRVRQAFSMAMDRRALANVSYDMDKLEQEGFPVLREQPSSPLPARSRYWLDPATRPWGYYYGYRPAEARRLLESAAWDFNLTVPVHFTNNRYGRAYTDSVEAVIQLLGQIGVKTQAIGHDYGSAWVDVWQRGDFDGIGYFLVSRFADPHDYFARIVHSKGQFNPGRVRDSVLDTLIEKEDTIFDAADREAHARQIVNLVNEQMYIPPLTIGTTMQYNVAQPWAGNVRNYFTTNTGAWYADALPYYWLEPR